MQCFCQTWRVKEENVSLCSFGGDASLLASTPVENLFLQEFMLGAPGDYVKVYLYGLMQAHYPALAEKNLDRFATSLGMERKELDKALAYWQKRNLLRVEGGKLLFVNVRSAVFGGKLAAEGESLYEFAAFSNRLDALAAEYNRPWKKREPDMLYDLLEDGFEEEAVFLLLEDGLKRHGKAMTSSRLTALMQEWRQKNLRKEESAREELLGVLLRGSPANGVLVKMGITQRVVSEAEHKLYEKWTGEWGFGQGGVYAALGDMTGVQSPNFKYLDKKLSSMKAQGNTSAQAILSLKERQEGEDQKIRALAYALGARGSVTDGWRKIYHRWTAEYKLEQDVLLALAADLNAQGVNTFKEAESRIAMAARGGLRSRADWENRQQNLELAARMRACMGLEGNPGENEIANLAKWLQDMPEDVLLYGAECAQGAQKPLGYATRILNDWQRAGVRSVAEAEAERKARVSAGGKRNDGKRSTAAYADQRQYGDERETLFEDLGDGSGT